jgi:hypothetical protein
MPIYEVKGDQLVAVAETSFSAEGIYERKHIQQLLKAHIGVLDERLMVIAEEFGDWLDSSRRIDLLCLDKGANLVVVELKRTDDGGHMELQAIRYAAMISAMTFDQLVETLARERDKANPDTDAAKADILAFLGWDEPDEDNFGRDTRLILAAADFGKELTTAVLWLIDRGIDIRCVRLKPYRMADGPVLMDIQQLIPLPETASFQTQIGVKRQAERQNRTIRHDIRFKYWERLIARPEAHLHRHITPGEYSWIGISSGVRGLNLNYVVTQEECGAELYIDRGANADAENKAIFDQLVAHQAEIDERFGAPLLWQRLEGRRACRVRFDLDGGYRSPESEWDSINTRQAEAMNKLQAVFLPFLKTLKLGI